MHLKIVREALLWPLQHAASIVDKRPTQHPIYGNVKLTANASSLALTGNDGESEMVAIAEAEVLEQGESTVAAQKLLEIARSVPPGETLELDLEEGRLRVRAGRGTYRLATLPPSEFPSIDDFVPSSSLAVDPAALRSALERTAFAMAHNDVRYFLNGVLFDVGDGRLRCVATEGHRLALAERALRSATAEPRQLIVPRKGVIELQRILGEERASESLAIEIGGNLLRVRTPGLCFTCKLIDARYPDYRAVMPINAERSAVLDRTAFREALRRAGILAHEKLRGVRLEFGDGVARVQAQNPEQEEAVEELDYEGSARGLSIGFNVVYLLEAVEAVSGERVLLRMRDGHSSILLQAEGDDSDRHVIMPLRL